MVRLEKLESYKAICTSMTNISCNETFLANKALFITNCLLILFWDKIYWKLYLICMQLSPYTHVNIPFVFIHIEPSKSFTLESDAVFGCLSKENGFAAATANLTYFSVKKWTVMKEFSSTSICIYLKIKRSRVKILTSVCTSKKTILICINEVLSDRMLWQKSYDMELRGPTARVRKCPSWRVYHLLWSKSRSSL